MFLITTADQRFWNTDEPVLFLGEWCKLFSQRNVWGNISYEVLPYHWEDREKLHGDYLYLDKLYEQILVQMRDLLNETHGVDHSLRYWRIIIGPWLYHFIQILYDRYSSIQTAIQSEKVTNTFIGQYDKKNWIPRDFPCFQSWFVSDDYNHYLYSQIIEFVGGIPFDIVEVKEAEKQKKDKGVNYRSIPKGILKRLIWFYEKLIPEHLNQIVLIASYLNTPDLIKFQLAMKQLPYLFPPEVAIPEVSADQGLRGKLILKSLSTEYERLLGEMIKMQIPLLYVEGYSAMNDQSLKAYPKNPKVLFTANAYFSNEAYKFWAAHNIDSGAKLVGSQHGGNHGTVLWSANNNHEIKISDRYFSWGWKSDVYKNVKPLVAAKLNTAKKIGHPKTDGRILVVLMTLPRYSYHMYSTPVATADMLSYFNDQYRFVDSLSKENQELVLVRLHRRVNQWSQKERWNSRFPDVECYKGSKSMLEQMRESRLLLCTYNSTTCLESFTANFPTVMFWNPDHWELNSSAQPYYDILRLAGILHDTPESAASLVNEISHDTLSWWSRPEIQKAKNEFCSQFAKVSENWLDEWKKELNSLLKTG